MSDPCPNSQACLILHDGGQAIMHGALWFSGLVGLAVVAMVAAYIWGRISDRTASS
jgi:hypothetical protein